MDHAVALDLPTAGKLQQADLARAIERLAREQHSTIARRQLGALGFSGHAIDHVVARGWLRVIHRGVYAVGPATLAAKGRWMAAVLAIGPGAVLSHRSAAALWRLRVSEGHGVDISIDQSRHRRAGFVVHRVSLAPDEVTTVDGIPVTTVARTLLDLAADLTTHRLERAMNEAEVQRLSDTTGLDVLMHRYPRRHGTRALRAILAGQSLGRIITRSEFEDLFLVFLSDNEFPRPYVNHQINDIGECDFVWPAARLIVELDGYETHGARRQFEADRARDRALTIAGWRVIRITWRQLRDEPRQLAVDLGELLGDSPAQVVA